jgi:hypothetical protein
VGAPDPIPLFGLGVQQKSKPSTAQLRVNLYYELSKDPDRSGMVAYGTPGLELFTNFGDTAIRGAVAPRGSDYIFFVHRGTLWQVDNAGTQTNRGTLNTTSGNVSMATDDRYIVIVDGTNGYTYDLDNPATPLAEITDAQFPDTAATVAWLDGYFVVNDGNQFYISAYGDPTAWAAADVATAESNADDIVRVVADHQELVLLGEVSIEFWANTGNADFPFERIPGAAPEWGLAARDTVAPFDESLMFLAQNKLGQVICAMLIGHRIQRVSTHDLEAKWAAYSSLSDAVAYSYMLDGHPFYVVSFPTGGETWMYDGSTGSWSQLKSYNVGRHRSNFGTAYLRRTVVTDYTNGKAYRYSSSVYTDNGEPIVREIIGRHVFDGTRKMGVDAFQLDIEVGVGLTSGQGSDPQAMLQISKDGGRTWGNERWRSFGALGEYRRRCIWRKCGRARNFTFRVRISDPVKVAIMGAAIQPRPGSS